MKNANLYTRYYFWQINGAQKKAAGVAFSKTSLEGGSGLQTSWHWYRKMSLDAGHPKNQFEQRIAIDS